MDGDISTGAKIGLSLVILCFLMALIMSLLMMIKGAANPGAQPPVLSDSDIQNIVGGVKVVGLLAGALIALLITNRFTHATNRISNWYRSAYRLGSYGKCEFAKGEMDMDFDTFYTLFMENPEKYIIGQLDSRYIPIILYSSTWKNTLDKVYMSVCDVPVRKNSVQIHLSYKDQRRLSKLLNESIFDASYRDALAKRMDVVESNSYAALAALDMRKDISKVVSAQNAANVEAAKRCVKLAEQLTASTGA